MGRQAWEQRRLRQTGLGVTPTLLLTNERCGLTNSLNLTQLAHPKNGDRRLVLWGAVYINMQRV